MTPSNSPLKKWLLEAVQEVPDARLARPVPAAGIQSNTEAYFLYVE